MTRALSDEQVWVCCVVANQAYLSTRVLLFKSGRNWNEPVFLQFALWVTDMSNIHKCDFYSLFKKLIKFLLETKTAGG